MPGAFTNVLQTYDDSPEKELQSQNSSLNKVEQINGILVKISLNCQVFVKMLLRKIPKKERKI